MNPLNRFQSFLFLLGGLLMVAGVGCYVFQFQMKVVCWVCLGGALLFAMMQIQQRYDGDSFVIRRLRRMMLLADVLFVVAGLLMVETQYGYLRPLFPDLTTYIQYIYNKWIIALLVAAILEIYTVHRISSELSKENFNKDKKR